MKNEGKEALDEPGFDKWLDPKSIADVGIFSSSTMSKILSPDLDFYPFNKARSFCMDLGT
jgi:hypothetical protein